MKEKMKEKILLAIKRDTERKMKYNKNEVWTF